MTSLPDAPRPWVAALLLQPGSPLRHRLAAGLVRLAALPRALRRRLPRLVSGAAVLGVALALGAGLLIPRPPALAAGIAVDGVSCTLADAIRSANTDTAVGGCAAGAGIDLITLDTDVILTEADGLILDELTGLPAITTELTLQGNGHTIGRDAAADNFRLMVIQNATVTLDNVTLSGGSGTYGGAIYSLRATLTLDDVTISGNTAETSGGAIHQSRGRLTLTGSTLSGNSAGIGGALYTYRGTLDASETTISGNGAEDGSGGGLVITYRSTADLTATTISDNAAGVGGGLHLSDSSVTVSGSLISGNTAELGGGFYAYGGEISLTTTAISDNTATYNGGGFYSYDSPIIIRQSTVDGNLADYGGGFYHAGASSKPLIVANSTISGNGARRGGGLFNSGNLELFNVTVSRNSATASGGGLLNGDNTLNLSRSLISGNTAPAGAELIAVGNTISSKGGNVFSHAGQTTVAALPGITFAQDDFDASAGPDEVALDNILSPDLADNGGPTQTHLLIAGSPAIDRNLSAACGLPPVNGIDQRGRPRTLDGDGQPSRTDCDAGAVEYDDGSSTATPNATAAPSATPVTVTPESTPSPAPTAEPTATPAATPAATATPLPGTDLYLPLIIEQP